MRVKPHYYMFLILSLLIALTACKTVEVPRTAQEVINEGNIYLTATSKQLTTNIKDKVITKNEAEGQLNDVRRYRDQLDNAQKLLDSGDITNAKTQSDIVHAAILSLRKRVFAKRTGAVQ